MRKQIEEIKMKVVIMYYEQRLGTTGDVERLIQINEFVEKVAELLEVIKHLL